MEVSQSTQNHDQNRDATQPTNTATDTAAPQERDSTNTAPVTESHAPAPATNAEAQDAQHQSETSAASAPAAAPAQPTEAAPSKEEQPTDAKIEAPTSEQPAQPSQSEQPTDAKVEAPTSEQPAQPSQSEQPKDAEPEKNESQASQQSTSAPQESNPTPAAAPTNAPQDANVNHTESGAQQEDDGLTHQDIAMPHVKYAQNTIRSLKSRREAGAFLQPVDPIALRIPHYTQIIKEPMDLGTIDLKLALTSHRIKLATSTNSSQTRMTDKLKHAIDSKRVDPEKDYYTTVDQFERDVFRVFNNCVHFNGAEHIFSKNAEVLRSVFEKQRKGLATAVAVAEEQNSPEARARRNSSALPTIRRSATGGRPKREIHPPPSRDLPWTEEYMNPASKRAVAARLGRSMENISQREQSYWAKVISDELKFCYRVIDDLLKPAHQDVAWVFYDLPAKDFDWAPAYYSIIKKPIALIPIQRKLKSGGHPDLAAFDADMQLMFRNCFTFNPPDSDVYIMGATLKDVYEAKMQKKPVPPPFPADDDDEDEDDDEDDDDDDEDDDDANAVLVQQLQKQIGELESTLETLESGKNKNPLLITSTRVALNSVQAALAGAMSVTGMSKRKNKKRSASSLDKKSKAGDKKRKSPAAKKPRTSGSSPTSRKRGAGAGSDEDDVRTVTFDQKEELAAKITELSDERLEGAIRIINEDKPPDAQGAEDEEIELDIDELSPQTLYKLYKYVVRPKKKSASSAEIGPNGKPVPASAPIDGRKRGTGGLKKKNLDEDEEAARIARLQQQLQQFNDVSSGAASAPAAASGSSDAHTAGADTATKHDDLVASESSSNEDESESESESDMD